MTSDRFAFLHRYKPHLMILAACILGYGLLAPSLGYYWDGWPFIWIPETYGNPGLVDYFATNRPVWGWLYQLTTPLIGNSLIAWQLFGLLTRWSTGYALWLLMRRLWPQQPEAAIWAALLFVVYPGFSQSAMANMYGHFYAVLAMLLVSLWLHLGTADRVRSGKKNSTRLYDLAFLASIALAAYSLFATEYFFGLELLRPGLLFVFLPAEPLRQKLRRLLALWCPFALMLPLYAYWRIVTIGFQNYDPVEIAATNPAARTLVEWGARIVGDVFLGGIVAWAVPFGKFLQTDWASRFSWVAVALAAGSAVACFLLLRQPKNQPSSSFARTAVLLGVGCLLLSGLPVWAISLPIRFSFPNDRLTLTMMAGSTLLLIGLISLLRSPILRRGLLALLVGSAIAFQFLVGADYRQDWKYQQSLFWQLAWRAPEIKPGTLLIMNELEGLHLTDNSLVAPLNWLYAPGKATKDLDYYAAFVPLRMQPGSMLDSLAPGRPLHSDYFVAEFTGTTDRTLVLLFDPPACLRVLDPIYDRGYPQLPDGLADALPLSAPSALVVSQGSIEPDALFGPEPSHSSWCYYFQRADLARQQQDWQQIASLGDEAYALDDSPNHAAEHLPFVEAYAMVGRWREASALTRQTLEINRFTAPMLCSLWQRVAANGEAIDQETITEMLSLSCE